jgi:hypothetical protein
MACSTVVFLCCLALVTIPTAYGWDYESFSECCQPLSASTTQGLYLTKLATSSEGPPDVTAETPELSTGAPVGGFNGLSECSQSGCVKPYVWSQTTVKCGEEFRVAKFDCRWPSGVNSRMDEIVYDGRIIAFKLKWFDGTWSKWFVPEMNDFDSKDNVNPKSCPGFPYLTNGLRRAWAYFYDHDHQIIICK